MMSTWHAVFEEDPYSRGFIFLQKWGDEGTRELFGTVPSEQVEDPAFERQLDGLMTPAKEEAARRNANDERQAISDGLRLGR